MKVAKCASVVFCLLLCMTACGKKGKEIPGAAKTMEKNRLVRILTDAVHAPFEFGAGTGVQGFDVDIGNEIGKDLNYEVKWIKASRYGRLFELLKNGEAEILLSAVAVDPAMSADFEFSEPYYDSGDVVARQRNKFDIADLASLSRKKVGVAAGRPGDTLMTSRAAAARIVITRHPTLDDALGALNRAEIDAVVGDEPFLTYSSFKSFHGTAVLPALVNKYRYAAVVRKGETELLAKINATISRLKSSGAMQKLDAAWFGNVRKDALERLMQDQAMEKLKKAPKTIGVSIKKLSGSVDMDSMDGFVLVLEGPQGTYQSTSIRTENYRGSCSFKQPVPPGEYQLAAKILFKGIKTITVPDYPKASLAMNMKLSAGGIEIIVQ